MSTTWLSFAGAVALLFATPQTPLAYVMACHVVLMVGVPLAMSPCQMYALSSLPHELSTDGSTMLNTMQQVLGAVCTALATFLLATGQSAYLVAGGADAAEAFAQGSHLVFAFALVLAAVSFALACRIKAQHASTEAAAVKAEAQGEAPTSARVATQNA
jgi:DHA2 family lincomycin resistance protein-like MFS transporter